MRRQQEYRPSWSRCVRASPNPREARTLGTIDGYRASEGERLPGAGRGGSSEPEGPYPTGGVPQRHEARRSRGSALCRQPSLWRHPVQQVTHQTVGCSQAVGVTGRIVSRRVDFRRQPAGDPHGRRSSLPRTAGPSPLSLQHAAGVHLRKCDVRGILVCNRAIRRGPQAVAFRAAFEALPEVVAQALVHEGRIEEEMSSGTPCTQPGLQPCVAQFRCAKRPDG